MFKILHVFLLFIEKDLITFDFFIMNWKTCEFVSIKLNVWNLLLLMLFQHQG